MSITTEGQKATTIEGIPYTGKASSSTNVNTYNNNNNLMVDHRFW